MINIPPTGIRPGPRTGSGSKALTRAHKLKPSEKTAPKQRQSSAMPDVTERRKKDRRQNSSHVPFERRNAVTNRRQLTGQKTAQQTVRNPRLFATDTPLDIPVEKSHENPTGQIIDIKA